MPIFLYLLGVAVAAALLVLDWYVSFIYWERRGIGKWQDDLPWGLLIILSLMSWVGVLTAIAIHASNRRHWTRFLKQRKELKCTKSTSTAL